MPHIVKRFIGSIVVLLIITFLSFAMMQWAPGGPGAMLMDPSMSTEDIAQLRQNLGLDQPLHIQYMAWLKEVAQGNLGVSNTTGQPVLDMITDRLPATLILSVSALLLILLITFPLGLMSGAKKGSAFDTFVTIFSFIGLAMPSFWVGLLLILGLSLKLNWLPSSGFLDPMLYDASLWEKGIDIMRHLILPLATIVIGGLAGLIRYNRFGIIQILNEDYIKAARARGISERRLLFKHAFKNAALPIITLLGLSLPGLIGGAFVIEHIFSWPGMGQLGISAIFSRDYPVLMGTILISSVLIIAGNLLADWAYAKVDPRIQKQ